VKPQPRADRTDPPAPPHARGSEGQRAQAIGQGAIGAQGDDRAPRQRQRSEQRRGQPAQADQAGGDQPGQGEVAPQPAARQGDAGQPAAQHADGYSQPHRRAGRLCPGSQVEPVVEAQQVFQAHAAESAQLAVMMYLPIAKTYVFVILAQQNSWLTKGQRGQRGPGHPAA
jgi:hypothetical protein